MKKRLIAICLMVFLSGPCAFAATPTKPYTDAADGQVLTALWLNGMFSTIYTWAQGANTDITTLKSGVVGSTELLGTIASATASTTRAVVWTSTGLDYVTMTSSGTMGFDIDLVAASPTGSSLARIHMEGAMANNASGMALIGDIIKTSWFIDPALDATVVSPGTARLRVTASTTASVAWKAKIITHEINY